MLLDGAESCWMLLVAVGLLLGGVGYCGMMLSVVGWCWMLLGVISDIP